MSVKALILSFITIIVMTLNVHAEPDLKKGKKLFKKCVACHVVDKEKNKVGPYLKNVFGRKAAAVEKYKYSKAMKKKGEEGLTWNEETLDKYLEKPRKFIPKTKMVFAGIKKEKHRKNLIAYIKTFSEIKETPEAAKAEGEDKPKEATAEGEEKK